jgi:Kef-type K+ transport system membrane component KefB
MAFTPGKGEFDPTEEKLVLKRVIIGLVVLLSLPFVALAVAIGYLLFAEWRERRAMGANDFGPNEMGTPEPGQA